MGVTRRDISGVFDAELKGKRSRKAAVLDKAFNLSSKGMTFVTDNVHARMDGSWRGDAPANSAARRDQHTTDIGCRGVVVQCTRRGPGKGFQVVLMFLDLPKRAQAQLSAAPSTVAPLASRFHADFMEYLHSLLKFAVNMGASDIHVKTQSSRDHPHFG